MKPRLTKALLILLTWLVALSVAVLALGHNPPLFFTANTTAPGPSPTQTTMEQALLQRLNNAATSIDAALYSLNRASIRDALIAAHNRGVAVRVVADDEAYTQAAYNAHFAALQTAGIPLVLDNRTSLMHNKFLVIDGALVWTGSTNLTDTGFTYHHNHSLVFTSTELAQIYTTEFDEMFTTGLFGTAKTNNTTHTLTYAGFPLETYFSPTDNALAELISEVNAADSDIAFAIYYFTDDALRDALIARKQAGITVTGIFDQLGAGNQYAEDEALCNAGAAIKIEDFGGLLHHKFMVIDAGGLDPTVITGSMNWTASGDTANDENTLIIHDPATAQAYLTEFQKLYDALPADTRCTPAQQYKVFLPLVTRASAPVTPNDLQITDLVYDGTDEYVTIRNNGPASQLMTGWTLTSVVGSQTFDFPAGFTLSAGATVRIHSGPAAVDNPPTDLKWSGAYYWANDGDQADLRDGTNALRATYCYGSGCS